MLAWATSCERLVNVGRGNVIVSFSTMQKFNRRRLISKNLEMSAVQTNLDMNTTMYNVVDIHDG